MKVRWMLVLSVNASTVICMALIVLSAIHIWITETNVSDVEKVMHRKS